MNSKKIIREYNDICHDISQIEKLLEDLKEEVRNKTKYILSEDEYKEVIKNFKKNVTAIKKNKKLCERYKFLKKRKQELEKIIENTYSDNKSDSESDSDT